MKGIRPATKPPELLNKIKIVLKYFLCGGHYLLKIKSHLQVVKALKYYRKKGLIKFRAYFIYILPFVSKSLNSYQKQQILLNHYLQLKNYFSDYRLVQLFTKGIKYYQVNDEVFSYAIYLQAVTNHLEFEGSLSLLFKMNELTLYTLSFTIVPGNVLGYRDEVMFYISAIQGVKDELENIRIATRYFSDLSLPTILLTALQAIGKAMNIRKCIGVAVQNQISYNDDLLYGRFHAIYDVFWVNAGGVFLNGNYLISFPVKQKPITAIKQTHRNRTLKKRQKLSEIYRVILENEQATCK